MKQNDHVISLLKQTDEAMRCNVQPHSADFVKAVRSKVVKRKRHYRNVCVSVLIIVFGFVGVYSKVVNDRKAAVEIAALKEQSTELLEQSRLLVAVITELNVEDENKREIAQLQNELAEIKQTLLAQQHERDMAAMEIFQAANNMAENDFYDRAMETYKCIITYFPESEYAAQAEQKMKKFEESAI